MTELGHPVLAELVGSTTRFQRAESSRQKQLDIVTAGVEQAAAPELEISFWPSAEDEGVAVQARQNPGWRRDHSAGCGGCGGLRAQ